jgi:glyoxylase-like metal-dependent hydrolase (beta-lactamase superfamily II)
MLLQLMTAGPAEGFPTRARAEADRLAKGGLHPIFFVPGIQLVPLRTPTIPPAKTTNTYLVGESRVWIVDPATPHADEQARLFELLDAWRAQGRQLAGILVTHHHEDHVGAVVATSQRYSLPVSAHALTLERLPRGFVPGRALADGDAIEVGDAPDGLPGWHLSAVFTPGHDRGHLCFVDSRYRAALVGDLCSTLSTIVIDPPEGHLRTYLDSLRRVLDLGIGTLLPAHGPGVQDGRRVLRDYLVHRHEREVALRAALGETPRAVADLVPEVYGDTDQGLWPLAARSLLAGLQKLEEDGLAERQGDLWRRRRS